MQRERTRNQGNETIETRTHGSAALVGGPHPGAVLGEIRRHGCAQPPPRFGRSRVLLTHPVKHHRGGEQHGLRTGAVATGDIRRAAVGGLEHGRLRAIGRIQVARRCHPHAAGKHGGKVGENIALEIAGDHHVERPGAGDELHAGSVDELVVAGDVRIVARDGLERLTVELSPVRQRVALGNETYLRLGAAAVGQRECPIAALARSTLRRAQARPLESMADDPLGTAACKHLDLGGDFRGTAGGEPSALADVLALAVLTDHQHVHVLCPRVGEKLRGTVEKHGRSLARPLVESLANVEQR